jgi:hypothetical protein
VARGWPSIDDGLDGAGGLDATVVYPPGAHRHVEAAGHPDIFSTGGLVPGETECVGAHYGRAAHAGPRVVKHLIPQHGQWGPLEYIY